MALRAFKSVRYKQIEVNAPIRIDSLISPLRYDVIVRKEYFEFFREHRSIFERNFSEYVAMAHETSYYRWFCDIACKRFSPELLDDDDALQNAFQTRIQNSAVLHDSYSQRGFDVRRPIILRAGKVTLPADSGKRIIRSVYTGGGCHRIALLLLDGMTELPPEYVRVRLFREYSPLDNTFRLISSLRLPLPNYYRFLSLGYADRRFDTKEELRSYIERTAPRRLSELDLVLEIDEPVLLAANDKGGM